MRLKDKNVLITGAVNPRGIGFGIARVFAAEGANIVLHYLNDDQELVAEALTTLEKQGVKAAAVQGDITKRDEVDRIFSTAINHLGGLDILVNNAGMCQWETLAEMTEKGLTQMTRVNLIGTLICTQWAARYMKDQGVKGRIINISSCNARRPNPGMGGYGGVKAGMDLMTQSLAMELAPLGITVNQVWPGYVLTDINKGQPGGLTDEGIKNSLKTIPVGVMATPTDIADAALFFAEETNKTVTGAVIKVDGGAFIKCLQ